jgi:lipopolysaccharide transport protein LptA
MAKRFLSPLVLLLVWCAAAYPVAVRAQESKIGASAQKEKIHIASESLVVNDAEKYAEFIGGVKAVQGQTVIVSDRLKIYYEGSPRKSSGAAPGDAGATGDSIKKIVATGNVKITFEDTLAESREAVYTTADRMLVLSGPNAKVTKTNSGTISGSKISINRESGQIKFEGKVEGLFFPGEKGID